MTKTVRKAVFPVAGFGTRFLPATKSMPKELMPVVDKPLIQYAAEEAVRAGIDTLIFVTGRHKRAIEDHFDSNPELEAALRAKGRHAEADMVRNILPEGVECVFVRQPEQRGLGHVGVGAASASAAVDVNASMSLARRVTTRSRLSTRRVSVGSEPSMGSKVS